MNPMKLSVIALAALLTAVAATRLPLLASIAVGSRAGTPAVGLGAPRSVPLALGVSVDTPEVPVRDVGVGPTAPANLYHFVTHPALAFVPGS